MSGGGRGDVWEVVWVVIGRWGWVGELGCVGGDGWVGVGRRGWVGGYVCGWGVGIWVVGGWESHLKMLIAQSP